RLHDQYHELFDREVTYVRANQNYAQSRYQQERDKLVESTLGELDLLKAQLRERLKSKLENLDQAARTAREIASVSTLVVLILGILISLTVSRTMEAAVIKPAAAPDSSASSLDATSVERLSFTERVQQWVMRQALRKSN
ncbi:MAG TPA: hypothetical protein VF452_03215, partial [Candidatus Binatia bacterium]